MKKISTYLLILYPLAVGCGYAGIEDLSREQLGGPKPHGPSSGGKTGDGDVGDGDSSLGGAPMDMGGANSGTGGTEAASGGAEPGSGGAVTGTGGIWETDEPIWSDPNRSGCWPFCEVVNRSFSTHYLFEQPFVPAPGVESSGALSISTDYAHWGIGSLAVHVEGSPAHAFIPVNIVHGPSRGIFVRAWLYVPTDAITGDVGLLDFLSGSLPAGLVKTHPGARLSVEAPLSQKRAMSAAGIYPFDEWFCLRAAVYRHDLVGSVTVEANELVVAELVDADTRVPGGPGEVNTVNFGITSTGPHQVPGGIYWDSLVVDQEPVSCDDMTPPL